MTEPPDSKTAIWIDLDNSPHVPLFSPIIEHFRNAGVDVILTARDHSQTIQLLDLNGFGGSYTVIGRHYGAGKMSKLWGTIVRARQLRKYIRTTSRQVSVAVSHG